jgi:hypothetical protein
LFFARNFTFRTTASRAVTLLWGLILGFYEVTENTVQQYLSQLTKITASG